MSRAFTSLVSTLGAVYILGAVPVVLSQAALPVARTAQDGQPLLRAGDVIRLRVWREPDLSGDFPVSEDGTVYFPKIGPLKVSHASSATLRATLDSAFGVYLKDPSIDVTLLRRLNILGEVGKPGLYQVDPTITVADALALAGGITTLGNKSEVYVLRNGERIAANLSGQTTIADSPIQAGDQIFVPQRGWLSRNFTMVTASISAVATVIFALSRR